MTEAEIAVLQTQLVNLAGDVVELKDAVKWLTRGLVLFAAGLVSYVVQAGVVELNKR